MKQITSFAILMLAAGLIQFGHSPAPIHRHRHAPAMIRERHGGMVTTGNWSGYAVTGAKGSVTDVQGSWTVPKVNCDATNNGTPNAYASFWVGIDGFNSNTVEQIGVDSDCVNGQPSYEAWYEFYPHWPYSIGMTISPGDVVSAEVSAGAKGTFNLILANTRTGQNFKISQKMNNAAQTSAEWVAEAPWSGGILPLANFGTVAFGSPGPLNTATVGNASGAIGSFPPANVFSITMVDGNGNTKAAPLPLAKRDQSSFSIVWYAAGP